MAGAAAPSARAQAPVEAARATENGSAWGPSLSKEYRSLRDWTQC